MLNKLKIFLKSFAAIGMGVCLLSGAGYFYLDKNINKPADTEAEKVPYHQALPQNVGAVFAVGVNKVFLYLDFSRKETAVIFADGLEPEVELYGYEITNRLNTDYDTVGGIVDILGGIDLTLEGKSLNYTGTQVSYLLKTYTDSSNLRRQIITQILTKIAVLGFSPNDMLYIIENSNTDLSLPQCYAFIDYLPATAKNFYFVN